MTEAEPPMPLMPRVGTDVDLERYLDVASQWIGLPIADADRAAVVENLRGIAAVAALLVDEPLSDDLESAPVFEA